MRKVILTVALLVGAVVAVTGVRFVPFERPVPTSAQEAAASTTAQSPTPVNAPVVDADRSAALVEPHDAASSGEEPSANRVVAGTHVGPTTSAASLVVPSAMPTPSEASLIENGSGLLQNAAFAALAGEPLDPFLRRLEADAGPVASALAFEYRAGVMATLPRDGAQLRHMACGSSLCVLDVWFPDAASRDGWTATAFGPGGLPQGRVQIAFAIPDGRGWQYRAMFAVDPRIVAIVVPPTSPGG